LVLVIPGAGDEAHVEGNGEAAPWRERFDAESDPLWRKVHAAQAKETRRNLGWEGCYYVVTDQGGELSEKRRSEILEALPEVLGCLEDHDLAAIYEAARLLALHPASAEEIEALAYVNDWRTNWAMKFGYPYTCKV
jgi:hypothetical protein